MLAYMKNLFDRLEKLDYYFQQKYPSLTWTRQEVLEYTNERDNLVYYSISYRLISPSGRFNAKVTWQPGKEPKLEVRR